MRRVVVTLVLLMLSAPASLAAPARPLDVGSRESILGWINGYRPNPDPAPVP